MDADLEKLIRDLWADLRTQIDNVGRAPTKASNERPLPELAELEPLDLSELEGSPLFVDVSADRARLDRIEARLKRLERHLGLLDE